MVVALFPASVRTSGWTAQDKAEFYRAADVLASRGLDVDVAIGTADEGDPWVAFCNPQSGDVIAHFAVIDGQLIAHDGTGDTVVEGGTLRALIDRFLFAPLEDAAGQTEVGETWLTLAHPANIDLAVHFAAGDGRVAAYDAAGLPVTDGAMANLTPVQRAKLGLSADVSAQRPEDGLLPHVAVVVPALVMAGPEASAASTVPEAAFTASAPPASVDDAAPSRAAESDHGDDEEPSGPLAETAAPTFTVAPPDVPADRDSDTPPKTDIETMMPSAGDGEDADSLAAPAPDTTPDPVEPEPAAILPGGEAVAVAQSVATATTALAREKVAVVIDAGDQGGVVVGTAGDDVIVAGEASSHAAHQPADDTPADPAQDGFVIDAGAGDDVVVMASDSDLERFLAEVLGQTSDGADFAAAFGQGDAPGVPQHLEEVLKLIGVVNHNHDLPLF